MIITVTIFATQIIDTHKMTDKSSNSIILIIMININIKILILIFKLTYLFESPINKAKTWTTWNLNAGIEVLAKARTFASEEEHQLLGFKGKMLSYNSGGFDLPLYSEDEPALHKLLDLFGDLSLTGINPLKIKAHFVSLKGGHALNTQMARALQKIF